MRNLNFVFMPFLLFAGIAAASVLKVPTQYAKIQLAIESAAAGDTVLVSTGRYYENLDFKGKSIVVAGNFIYSHNWNDVSETIIDGSRPTNPDSASCVRITSPQSRISDTIPSLIGFTLTGGTGTVWEDEHNLGHYYREGGGVLIQAMAPRLLYNIIKFNEAYNKSGLTSAGGGAIRCGDGNPLIANNIIYRNKGRYGAGIVLNFSAGRIQNNIINSNWGGEDYGGSGIWVYGANPGLTLIHNNTIVKNVVTGNRGGGLYIVSAAATVRNNIIWANSAANGPQIYVNSATIGVSYCDVQGGYSGVGNLNAEPQFQDSSFVLLPGSPCVDAGDTASAYRDQADPQNPLNALYPSRGLLRNDIGAYGGIRAAGPVMIITSVERGQPRGQQGYEILKNFPNPFNPSTNISFNLPSSGYMTLKIYDNAGREIVKLVDGYRSAGRYTSMFTPASGASSVYYCRLDSESCSSTIKLMFLK